MTTVIEGCLIGKRMGDNMQIDVTKSGLTIKVPNLRRYVIIPTEDLLVAMKLPADTTKEQLAEVLYPDAYDWKPQ